MNSSRTGHRPITGAFFGTLATLGVSLACAHDAGNPLSTRIEQVDAEIAARGLDDHMEIHEARFVLEAALARENGEVLLDGIQIRASAVNEEDTKMETLVRVPIGNILEVQAERKSRRAATEIALAKLEEATLEQQLALCLPSLHRQLQEERVAIYGEYARRQEDLIEWNRNLQKSGLLDEIQGRRFELLTRTRLGVLDPAIGNPSFESTDPTELMDVLPQIELHAPALKATPELIRRTIIENQPVIAVLNGNERRFQALAKRENVKQLPSLRFVDFGFEAVPYAGDTREYEAKMAFDIPFGREARANSRRFEALARAQESKTRGVIDERLHQTQIALAKINAFRATSEFWVQISQLARQSEEMADHWSENRLASPKDISKLIDSVYDARSAILKIREGAARAHCSLLHATGLTASEWPI